MWTTVVNPVSVETLDKAINNAGTLTPYCDSVEDGKFTFFSCLSQ